MLGILKNRISRNAGWIVGCKLVQAAAGLFVTMQIARYLGPSRYGTLNYAVSLATFITPVAQLGLTSILVHEFVSDPEREGETLGTAMLMSIVSSVLCILSILGFLKLDPANDTLTISVCLLYSLALLAQCAELIQYWFQSKLLSKFSALMTLFAYLTICGYQLWLIGTGKGLKWFALAKCAEYSMIACGLFVIYRRKGGKRLSFSVCRAKRMLGDSWHYILSTLLVMTFAHTDRLMIKSMIGDTAMGLYSAAVVCANLTEFVFIGVFDSVRPVILEKKAAEDGTYEHAVSAVYGLTIGLALLQSLLICAFAKTMIKILYGAAFLPATNALRIIVWYTAFSYIGFVRNIWILAEGLHRYLWIINGCGALANVLLNAVMIPHFGIEGAAAASLITQAFTNVALGYIIKPVRRNNHLMLKGINPAMFRKNLQALLKTGTGP